MSEAMSAFQNFQRIADDPPPLPFKEKASAAGQYVRRIVIADDLPGLRNHLAAILQNAGLGKLEVIQVSNGQEAVEAAMTYKPDLIIMDIAMPVLNGLKAAKQIWSDQRNAKIIFWSQFYREIYIRDLARIVPDEAVHGYVLKSGSDDNFIYAVQCVLLHDNPYFDPVVRTVKARISQKSGCLSDVELETLNDLMLGLTDRAIAIRRHISLRGVQSRIGSLYTKLLKGEDDRLKQRASGTEIVNQRARLIFEAVRRGLISPDDLGALDDEFYAWINETF